MILNCLYQKPDINTSAVGKYIEIQIIYLYSGFLLNYMFTLITGGRLNYSGN